jgi:16S rRNA (cytidine1402-2'-O)-methyltransferase
MIVRGRIYLIPVTLGDNDFQKVIPEKVISITKELRYFIVEDLRSARRFLRLIDKNFPIDSSVFFVLNEHTAESEISFFLDPLFKGFDIGIMSEAGLPCIADPGAKIVALAHRNNIIVKPLSGPSSIILALISSGFNGQNFCFNGYLPVKPAERISKLRELEKKSKEGVSQIFMETPYRNQKMLESVLETCHPDINLCIAADITLLTESITTKTISSWKTNIPQLGDKMVIFIL